MVDVDNSAVMDEEPPLSDKEDGHESEAASTDDGEGSGPEVGEFVARTGFKEAQRTVNVEEPKKETEAESGRSELEEEEQRLGRKLIRVRSHTTMT